MNWINYSMMLFLRIKGAGKRIIKFLFLSFIYVFSYSAVDGNIIIDEEDLLFLRQLTKDVLESSRIYPTQKLPEPFGVNNTGGVLIRPGGKDTYPAFWIRDYAMSLETGFIKPEEQKHMLLLTAKTQCDQTWITQSENAMIPVGAIADHILVDTGLPIYFPGTYDYNLQGSKQNQYGLFPPYCDQFFFIKMAYYYIKSTSDINILVAKINGKSLLDRLELAFNVPPTKKNDNLVFTVEPFNGVDFGFRDAIHITGELCFPSILKYKAAKELSELYSRIKDNDKATEYNLIALNIKRKLNKTFLNENGMLNASTGKSAQPDVWATALAIFMGLLNGDDQIKASNHLRNAYKNGKLAHEGNIRHIITDEDFNKTTAWEVAKVPKNIYQNGSFWGTPTGWVAYAISLVDTNSARQLVKEYIEHLKKYDYRKGENFGAPYECIFGDFYKRGPVYLTSVSCPFIVLNADYNAMKEHQER